MSKNLVNCPQQSPVSSLAARRMTRFEKQKQNGNRPSLAGDSGASTNAVNHSHYEPVSCTASNPVSTHFTFKAPSGKLVTFPRQSLLPRSSEFAPPAYDSLDVVAASLLTSPASPRPSVRDQEVVVHVRELSPAPSQGSMPSYRAMSPGPPTGSGLTNYIIPGMEVSDPESMESGYAFYATAPFVSNPDLPWCTSPSCPIHPAPHHLGLYYEDALRPGEAIQRFLRQLRGIFDGANPPKEVWWALMSEMEGEGTEESRKMIERYMRFHCENGEFFMNMPRDSWRVREWEEAEGEEGTDGPMEDRESPSPSEFDYRSEDYFERAEREIDRLRPPTTTHPRTQTQDPDPDPENSNPDPLRTTTLTYWSFLPHPRTPFLKLGLLPPPHQYPPSSPISPSAPNNNPLCTSPACPLSYSHNPSCSYSSPHHNLNLVNTHPPAFPSPSPSPGIYSPHQQNTYIHPITMLRHPGLASAERARVLAFLDDVGLGGVFGEGYPDPGTLAGLMMLVQGVGGGLEREGGMEGEREREMVEMLRHFHVFGNRPVGGAGEEGGWEGEECEEGGEEDEEGGEEWEGEEDEEEEGEGEGEGDEEGERCSR
ncbi:MAG: hypothetical protein HETSPECPRED_010342 [Heterodermia speciosa]|uniref:Uncharacterized protein n=1 Tax=Heterodermia speciosa TaxID=116794 RepID=A0A8H3IZE4_9LECA|nr:MAG: hypothetical protein HETSPECPRED_010342 [Heterodermia speciosa]